MPVGMRLLSFRKVTVARAVPPEWPSQAPPSSILEKARCFALLQLPHGVPPFLSLERASPVGLLLLGVQQ